ncbi:hypothetical protein C2845_PM05G19660 [Panicum miliaceum]|uniref:Uncharacterized protein n=1 Tax=Panicum miliaceum TaxID=4540 RepID=A0A3L6T489_PANMI|nr:hypothetical protein C2845_PM05G19660 [Panicum miliaceum]
MSTATGMMAVGSLGPIRHARSREEELLSGKHKSPARWDSRDHFRSSSRVESSADTGKSKSKSKSLEAPMRADKLDFLVAYRKEKGLCFKCGDKWNKQHKCPPQVPLHIIEELLEVIDYPEEADSNSEDITTPVGNSLMAVSDDSPSLTKRRRTVQFRGLVGKQEALILVDSGSEYSFVNEAMVAKVQCSMQPIPKEFFTVADGGSISCTTMIPNMQWWTQGNTFTQDTRVIPLGSFDMILGADWLESHSPMWVHWKLKKMRFSHLGKKILLQGIPATPSTCRAIGVNKLNGLLRRKAVNHMIRCYLKLHFLPFYLLIEQCNTVHLLFRLCYISMLMCSKIQRDFHPQENGTIQSH